MILLALILATQTASADELSVMTSFVGGCWRAEFTATVADTHCFESVYDGAHVRDRHEVRENGKTIYAGETIYSADGPQTVFTYFNSLGGVGHGKVRADGGRTRFTGTMRASPDKALEPIDSEWRVVDADHYEVRSLVKGGSRAPEKPLVFSRVK